MGDDSEEESVAAAAADTSTAVAPSQQDIAGASRAGYEGWRQSRNGTLGGAVQTAPVRTNWFHLLLWPAIDEAMQRCDHAVKALKCE